MKTDETYIIECIREIENIENTTLKSMIEEDKEGTIKELEEYCAYPRNHKLLRKIVLQEASK